MSSSSEKRQCGLFSAVEDHKPAGGNEAGRRLGGLNLWDEYFWGTYLVSIKHLRYLSLAVWVNGTLPNTKFGFNILFRSFVFQNGILNAKMH